MRVAVLGATGALGRGVTARLVEAGHAVRVSSRSQAHLERAFGGVDVEMVAADVAEEAGARRAMAGCEAAIVAVGLPFERFEDHLRVTRAVIGANQSAGARVLAVTSFWCYLPAPGAPITPETPADSTAPYGRVRAEQMRLFEEAGVATAPLPDFYGPTVRASALNGALAAWAKGKAAPWLGPLSVAREHAYLPDVCRALAALIERPEVEGRRWIIGGDGPITGERVIEIASEALGRRCTAHAAGPLLMRIIGLFDKGARGFAPLTPGYSKPISFDASETWDLLAERVVTGYAEGIPATLAALARQG